MYRSTRILCLGFGFFLLPLIPLFSFSLSAAITEFRVNTTTTGSQYSPALAMNRAGRFVIAWVSQDQDGSGGGVYAQCFDSRGIPQGNEFQVNSTTAGDQLWPAVAMDDNGYFIITWQSAGQDGSGTGIYFRRFHPGCTPLFPELQVNSYTAGDQSFPAVAMDGNGFFVVAWHSINQDGSGSGIYARRYEPLGNPLGDEFQVNSYTAGDQAYPAVAMNSTGRFIVVWMGQDASGSGINAQRYDADGLPSGQEFRVNDYIIGDQGLPSVAMDETGRFLIAWQSNGQDGSGSGIYARRFGSNGIQLGDEFPVNSYTTSEQASPSAAMDPAGGFVITWHSYLQDGAGFGVYGRRYDSNGLPLGTEFRASDEYLSDQSLPKAALDQAGRLVIAWKSTGQDGSGTGIYARRFDVHGNAVPSDFQANSYWLHDQFLPRTAMDGSGRFVVTWTSDFQDGSSYGIYARRFDAHGNPLGGEFRVNSHTTSDQYRSVVAMNPSGRFVIAWESRFQDGSDYGIYAQRFDSNGSTLGTEFLVNSYTVGNQRVPAVAMDAGGRFVIVWSSDGQDGSGSGVYARRFDEAGNPLGLGFQVNSYTTGSQSGPTVAMDPNGRFVIAWTSEGQDGDGYGVYARRFDADGIPQGNEFQVSYYTTGNQSYPAVAMDPNGRFAITWHSDYGADQSGYGIYARLYDSNGNTLTPVLNVNSYTAGNQSGPTVAMDPSGRFVITWASDGQDGYGYGIYARRYDSEGNPLNGEFRVNTYSDLEQVGPSVASGRAGLFVIAWSSELQDGDGRGVFFKVYQPYLYLYLPLILK